MQIERLKLLLLGLAAGDSLGSTVEFQKRASMPRLIEQLAPSGWPFKQVGGGPRHWRPGAATDDTAMALCIVRSYLRNGECDGEDVATLFGKWLDSNPPDVGSTVRRTLRAFQSGKPWHEAALEDYQKHPGNAANGSLMRNGVIAGLADSLYQAFSISLQQGIITHYAPLPVLCCCAQTFLIWELLEQLDPFMGDWIQGFLARFEAFLSGNDDPVIIAWKRNTADDFPPSVDAFARSDFNAMRVDPYMMPFDGTDGYCLTTLQIAVWAAQWSQGNAPFPAPRGFPREPFNRARGAGFLPAVVMVGHDADTYGATAGPLIAAVHGSVPTMFTDGLEILDELEEL